MLALQYLAGTRVGENAKKHRRPREIHQQLRSSGGARGVPGG